MRLELALYGHPNSGSYWERHCDSEVQKVGFEPIPGFPSCYWHPRLKLLLVVCVDDFKLAGPAGAVKEGWALLRKGINMEEPQTVDEKGILYFGCKHVKGKVKLPNGEEATTMSHDL